MSSRPIICMSACPNSIDMGPLSSLRSVTMPSSLSTKTEFFWAFVPADPLATMPAMEIINKMPAITDRITMPQMVANVYFMKSFIVLSLLHCTNSRQSYTFFLYQHIKHVIFF